MFDNLKVEWVPGATPSVFFYGPNKELLKQSEIGDKDMGELLELLKQNNFVPARKKSDISTPQLATSTFQGNTYEVYGTPTYFDDAKAFAESKQLNGIQGHLLTISSAEEENAVSVLLNGTPIQAVWLAAQDSTLDGTWKWVAGKANGNTFWQDGTSLSYSNWRPGEPNNANDEDCATMVRESGWNDVSCDTPSYSVVVKYPSQGDPKPDL